MSIGAGSGIGRSTCRVLRDNGAKVIAADRNMTAAEETAKELGERGEYEICENPKSMLCH